MERIAPLLLLLRSRKFWLAVAAVVIPAVLAAFGLDADGELGQAIFTLALALIAGITIEDAAENHGAPK